MKNSQALMALGRRKKSHRKGNYSFVKLPSGQALLELNSFEDFLKISIVSAKATLSQFIWIFYFPSLFYFIFSYLFHKSLIFGSFIPKEKFLLISYLNRVLSNPCSQYSMVIIKTNKRVQLLFFAFVRNNMLYSPRTTKPKNKISLFMYNQKENESSKPKGSQINPSLITTSFVFPILVLHWSIKLHIQIAMGGFYQWFRFSYIGFFHSHRCQRQLYHCKRRHLLPCLSLMAGKRQNTRMN